MTPMTSLSRVPRIWRIVLVGSLALNLLVAGLALGAVLGPGGPPRGDRLGPAGPVVRALPEADRRAVLDELRRDRPPEARGDRRDRFDELLGAIAAEPFDPARVGALLARERKRGGARLERIEGAVIERLDGMDAAGRSRFARDLEKAIRRR